MAEGKDLEEQYRRPDGSLDLMKYCRDCGGKGAHADGPEDAFTCPTCKGTGVEDWQERQVGEWLDGLASLPLRDDAQ